MVHSRITAVAIALPLLVGGCESVSNDLAHVTAQEQQAETAIAALERIPADELTVAQTRLLAEYHQLEAALEAQRKAFEVLTGPALVRRGLEGGKDAVTGNWFGLLEGLIAVGAAAAAAFGGKHLANKDAGKQLADLEERLNRTLEPQGIAGLRSSSAQKATSDVARAAQSQREVEGRRLAAEAQKAAWDAQNAQTRALLQAQGISSWSAPIAPMSPPSTPPTPAPAAADSRIADLLSRIAGGADVPRN